MSSPRTTPVEDQPTQQPMRASSKDQGPRRNPSTDQKKVRRRMTREADWQPGQVECRSCGNKSLPVLSDTGPACRHCNSYQISKVPAPPENRLGAKQANIVRTRAEMLNVGDKIKMPNGRTQTVTGVPRPHETSMAHVYVDTDGGTALANRQDAFEVTPHNAQQQSLPGYGTPGGNTNHLPGDKGGGDNSATSNKCPVCGRGPLVRQGDHYVCSNCGYTEQFGGAGGLAFSDSPSRVRSFSTINGNTMSVIARRATALLDQEEHQ